MHARDNVSRITVEIPRSDHRKLKAIALELGTSMRAIVAELIEERVTCKKLHVPNKETQKVLKQMKTGKGLVRAKNAEDLFKKLGI